MTPLTVVLFAVGTYLLRLTGPVLSHRIEMSDRARAWLTLPAVALLAALAATATVFSGAELDSWARPAGVLVGVLTALRKLPFVVVVLVAAGTTAGLRLLGVP
ncbi:MAG TPA: AzlD domain-containing protein [Micromonosporaceae bacterium]